MTTRATASAAAHATVSARTPPIGRAVTVRRTKSPIADISDRNVSQRSAMSPGVTAVSDSDGMTNCGGGPGLGPIRYVNAPRTGWPSAEMTRQKTRYQPSAERFSGASSS